MRLQDRTRLADGEEVKAGLPKVRRLAKIARERKQSLAQMALAWVLRKDQVTSALIGASSVAQLEADLRALERLRFPRPELAAIEAVLQG